MLMLKGAFAVVRSSASTVAPRGRATERAGEGGDVNASEGRLQAVLIARRSPPLLAC